MSTYPLTISITVFLHPQFERTVNGSDKLTNAIKNAIASLVKINKLGPIEFFDIPISCETVVSDEEEFGTIVIVPSSQNGSFLTNLQGLSIPLNPAEFGFAAAED